MNNKAVRRLIVRTFKKHQLTLQLDATEYLEDTLEAQAVPSEDLNDTLENVAVHYVAREGLNLVSKARLQTVIESMQKSTHHLHERPTKNSIDPHRQTLTQSHQHHEHSQHHARDMTMDNSLPDMHMDEGPLHQQHAHGDDDMSWLDGGDSQRLQSQPRMTGAGDEEEEEEDDVDITELFHVIGAFDLPRWTWNHDAKTFIQADPTPLTQEPDLHGSGPSQYQQHNNPSSNTAKYNNNKLLSTAVAKTAMFRARYHLLLQKMMRNEQFAPPVFTGGGMEHQQYLKITPLKALRGRAGGSFLCFGMLVQMSDSGGAGKFCLEDLDEKMELEMDMQQCDRAAGMYTENTFVLVEGLYTEENVLKVRAIGLPPLERRTNTKKVFGTIDFLGAPRELRSEEQLRVISEEYEDIAFVILSDVWLDQPKTFTALRKIFQGYATSTVPLAFILCGSFKSEPFVYSGQDTGPYRQSFTQLGELIAEFPVLANFSYFVFVPGPNDPWGGTTLPRPKIPDLFTHKLSSLVKRAIFTTNPCRIKYCDQELVIFREDILNKLRRNCVIPPREDVLIQKQLVRTVIDGAHLCPLPLSVRPVYWAYDHALRLYPAPDAVSFSKFLKNW
ncbi:DNA polymerase epsilon subunit 2 [Actinomortierella ambigua]|uniref:DNA polymerase epsilon subunit B n=1 Tax=Actinomortierella ambigua TaxID=1343610 RepID=A0A9P6U855_9FUNG|nr:DNA polymerase epsilon subunit 2 [Actinomortierella ambigua]